MAGEILTLQVGQCGNQIGQQFWSQLSKEHGIGRDGYALPSNVELSFRDDNTSPFFKDNDNCRYTPRAIMLDLEPKVINDVFNNFQGLFDQRNVWVSQERYGAGNSWAKGYDEGRRNLEHILNIIDKELESTDNFEGFQLLHSVAGGTGSGLGSSLLEVLQEKYPKSFLTTYSVFPSNESEVVVQPYNTILTLRRLVEESDASIVFDNNAISNLSSRVFKKSNVGYNDSNQLIAAVMSSVTNSIRFPSYMYSSLQSIFSTLIPTPDLHFLTPSFTPFSSDYISSTSDYRHNTAYDVILDLIDSTTSLTTQAEKNPIYFNMFCTLIGPIDRNDALRGINKIQHRLQFAPWSATSIHINMGRRSPYLPSQKDSNYINGMMLGNSSGIVPLLTNSCETFDKIFAKRAFLNAFREVEPFDRDDLEFTDSRSIVQNVIDEYTAAEEKDYLDDILIDEENVAGNLDPYNQVDADGDNILN